jgi:CubicO group peptidase (beta-lactamase class C family)
MRGEQRMAVEDGLVRARAGEVGIDATRVEALLDAAAAAGLDLHSLMLHRRGHVAFEMHSWPYGEGRPRIMHSVAKSFTACAIGMALEEGRFALEDPVVKFFPAERPAVVSDNLAAMTIADLLTMRTGHAEETSGSRWRSMRSSWIEAFFKIPVVHRPGTVYTYTSAASYMLSAILTRATGQTLHDYLRQRLFEPLGILGERWDIGPDGINPGGNGLKCRTVDILKLGMLHAQRGVWGGRRILSESWVAAATRAHSDSGYGYHWMAGRDRTYAAMGVFGQLVVVFADYGATLAITSGVNGENACSETILPLVYRHLQGAFHDAALPPSEAETRLRQRAVAVATIEPLKSLAAPPRELAGVLVYDMTENAQGITRLRLELTPGSCTLRLADADGEHVLKMGVDSWIESDTDMPGRELHHGYELRPGRVLAGARWLDPWTLEMRWIFAETAFRDTVVCRFEADRVSVARSVNVNSGPLSYPSLSGRRVAP